MQTRDICDLFAQLGCIVYWKRHQVSRLLTYLTLYRAGTICWNWQNNGKTRIRDKRFGYDYQI